MMMEKVQGEPAKKRERKATKTGYIRYIYCTKNTIEYQTKTMLICSNLIRFQYMFCYSYTK